MSEIYYPEDILVEVIHKFAEDDMTRQDWLPLRLVNRFFNQHILFTLYVLYPKCARYMRTTRNRFSYYASEKDWVSPRFATLERSWWLQGQLVRGMRSTQGAIQPGRHVQDSILWKEMVDKAANLISDYLNTTTSVKSRQPILTGFVGNLRSPVSPAFQKSRELVCDAFACLSTIETLARDSESLQSIFFFPKMELTTTDTDTVPTTVEFDWLPCDIFFLTMCFLGDLDAIQHSLSLASQIHMDDEEDDDDVDGLRCAGLYVALRQHGGALTSLMLELGFEVFDEQGPYFLGASAQTGNTTVFRALLDTPDQSSQEEIAEARRVVIHAAEYPDTTVRIDMCRLLLPFCGDMDMGWRTEMLAAACRSNDVTFAEWIMGAATCKCCQSRTCLRMSYRRPLLMAVGYGNLEILRYLLQFEAGVLVTKKRLNIWKAFEHARNAGHFGVYMELVAFQLRLGRQELLKHAAAVEHAVEAVNKMLPTDTSETASDLDHTEMMENAVDYQCIANIEYLLKQGFRTGTSIQFQAERYHSGPARRDKLTRAVFDRLRRIEATLRAYGNPGIRLRCCYRCKAPKLLSEILELPEPWHYKCLCRGH